MCCDDDSNLKVPRASFLGVINKLFLHVLVKRARLERGARRDWSLASALSSPSCCGVFINLAVQR